MHTWSQTCTNLKGKRYRIVRYIVHRLILLFIDYSTQVLKYRLKWRLRYMRGSIGHQMLWWNLYRLLKSINIDRTVCVIFPKIISSFPIMFKLGKMKTFFQIHFFFLFHILTYQYTPINTHHCLFGLMWFVYSYINKLKDYFSGLLSKKEGWGGGGKTRIFHSWNQIILLAVQQYPNNLVVIFLRC